MTLIKICGITREDDAELAVTLGADFLGFIFVRESARYVTPERARAISASTSRQARPLTRPLATLSRRERVKLSPRPQGEGQG